MTEVLDGSNEEMANLGLAVDSLRIQPIDDTGAGYIAAMAARPGRASALGRAHMPSSLGDPVCVCQAGGLRSEFRMNALVQASGPLSHLAAGPSLLWLAALCVILFATLVVCPAVWSSKPSRRKAALAVLDRLIRWRL